MADEASDLYDDQLMDELREAAARVDPVPARLLDAAKQTFTWRTVDEELAQLTYDSLLDERSLAGARSSGGARALTFEGVDVAVEVEIIDDGVHRTLVGQLVPPQPGEVTAAQGDATTAVTADELGRFVLRDMSRGPLRLRVLREGAEPFTTEWINI